MADATTTQDGDITDPATWGGTLPGSSQTAEIVNACTLADGESFTAASLTITGTLTTTGSCAINADVIANNADATPLTQTSGTLTVAGCFAHAAVASGTPLVSVGGDVLNWTGDITYTCTTQSYALFMGTGSAAVTVNGNVADSGAGSTLFYGPLASLTINGVVTTAGSDSLYGGAVTSVCIGNSGGGGVYPATSAVLLDVSYGPANNLLGTYRGTNADDVRVGVVYGAADTLTGTLNVPNAADVLLGVAVDATAGTYCGPSVDKVQAGYQYGPNDTLTGTLAAGGPVTLTPDERNAIADAVLSRTTANVEATADPHSLCYVVLAMSESDATTHPGKLTVFCSDGATEFIQKTISAQAGAATITGVH
jgi:hypothetical protein